jgi:hypothetical protein
MSAMISAAIPLKRKRIPKQHFDAPAAAAAPPAMTPPAMTAAADKKGRVKTKAVRSRGAPLSRVKMKAVSHIGLTPPPPSKATAPSPSVPSAPTPVMTHKYRGCIVVLSINKSVELKEEQKVLMSGFDQGFTVNTSKQVFRGI